MVKLVIINAKCSTVNMFKHLNLWVKNLALQGAVSTVEALDQTLEFKWHEHCMVVHSNI